jgi:hypothetical protein
MNFHLQDVLEFIPMMPEIFTCRYGSYPLRGKHCHEMALRILLACIEVRLRVFFLSFYMAGEQFAYLQNAHTGH